MSLTWSIAGPGDDPLFKPLEVKNIRARKGPPMRDSDFVGPKCSTRRSNSKTDILLKFDGKTYKAHKHVLKEASELFKKNPLFNASPKRAAPGAGKPKPTEYDLSPILPDDAKEFDTLNKVIDFAYMGRLPLATDVGFKHFFVTAVALEFNEALRVYDMYFINLFKKQKRILPVSAAAIILSQCEKIRMPTMLSECAEYLESIRDHMSKYILKERLENLYDDGGFIAYMSGDALVAFHDRDDLAKPADETKVLNLALTWLKFTEMGDRQQYTKKVLKKVHLGLVPQERLRALLSEVQDLPDCKTMVEEVIKLQDSKSDVTVPLKMTHPNWFSARKEMVVNALIGIGPGRFGGQTLVYFNTHGKEDSLGWKNFCEFEGIPHDVSVYDSSVVTINGKLYVAGGICKPGKREYRVTNKGRLRFIFKWNSWFFHEGKVGEPTMQFALDGDFASVNITNPWTTLPELETVRNSFSMVHLDGHLYAIGGQDEDYQAIRQVERYSFRNKKWEKLADLPVPCYYACAMVYKGNILVYGSQPVPDSDTPAQHNLQMYNPATNKWTELLTEHHKVQKYKKQLTDDDDNANSKPSEYIDEDEYGSDEEAADWADNAKNRERDCLLPRNAIVAVKGDCYRVVYPAAVSGKKQPPLVHKLVIDFKSDTPTCKVGGSLDQWLMPTTGEGAFQIRNSVYINMKGVVHNTGIKIAAGQKTEVDLGVWKKLQGEDFLEKLSFANLTFDKKKIFCENCVREKQCVNAMEFMRDDELMAMVQESDSD